MSAPKELIRSLVFNFLSTDDKNLAEAYKKKYNVQKLAKGSPSLTDLVAAYQSKGKNQLKLVANAKAEDSDDSSSEDETPKLKSEAIKAKNVVVVKKKTVSSSEDSSSEEETKPPPVIKKAIVAVPKRKAESSSSEDSSEEEKPAAKKPTVTKPAVNGNVKKLSKQESSSEDSSDEEEAPKKPQQPAAKPPAATAVQKRKHDTSEDSSDEEEPPAKKPNITKPAVKKAESSSDDSSDDEDVKKPAPPLKKAAPTQSQKPPVKKESSSDDSSSEDELPATKKPAVAQKPVAKPPAKKESSSDDTSSEEDEVKKPVVQAKTPATATAKKPQAKKEESSSDSSSEEETKPAPKERLWIDHHSPHHHTHHPHPRTDLVYPMSPENGFGKVPPSDSPASSDSEDLHYGPGIVNRLRNKYLSLALRESNNRPTILRKATSLENLLDDDGGEETEKEDMRLFARRSGGHDGANRYRSSSRRRSRSVEVISRTNHEEELTMTSSVTAKINNRQSLHEDMLAHINENKGVLIENTKSYKRPVSIENGTEDSSEKYNRKINRPKRISPLLNEREKPPVDVVKHAKMIFEKPETEETRTKKPVQTGEVAAKVDSFNDIIVKTKVALKSTKPAIKTTKPVLHDKPKSNTHHHVRPVAKPVIISEQLAKPKTLELKSPRQEKKGFNSLPSPIPDVRVDIKHPDGMNPRNNLMNYLCETPDFILTSSPLPKITSPTYANKSWQNLGNIVEKQSRIFENLSKNIVEDLISVEASEEVIIKSVESDKLVKSADKIEIVDQSPLKTVVVQSKSASDSSKSSIVDGISEDKSKVVLPKKTKSRQEESGVAVFNFTSRKDVPDYISNDTSRAPMRPVIPKLKISFIDDAEIYEYPSETSMLLEDSHAPALPSHSQVGHTIPTLSGSSLASYTPKTTEAFQLGVTKSFQEPPPVETQEDQQTVQEEPVLFSSGSTSDILF